MTIRLGSMRELTLREIERQIKAESPRACGAVVAWHQSDGTTVSVEYIHFNDPE